MRRKLLSFVLAAAVVLTLIPGFSVTSKAETTFEKATSIAVGDKVVFAFENDTVKKELSSISSNIGQVTNYTNIPAGTMVFDVVAGNAEGSFAFKNGSIYLCYNGSSNQLHTTSSVEDKSSWTIDFDANGKVTAKNVTYTTRYLQYNTSSPRFACYTGSQQPFIFYKQVEVVSSHVHSYEWNSVKGTKFQHILICTNTEGTCVAPSKQEACKDENNDHVCDVCGAEVGTPDAIVKAAYALDTGEALPGTYTLEGTITAIPTAYDSVYKNITVDIAVKNANEPNTIKCFRMKASSNEGMDTAVENLVIGDEITVYGVLKNYGGTIEFDANCELMAVTKNTHSHSYSWDGNEGTNEKHTETCTSVGGICDAPTRQVDCSFDTGNITTAAGCTTPGVKTYTCTVCGYEKTESIPATGHVDESPKDGVCDVCHDPMPADQIFELTSHLPDGDYVFGAVKGAAGTDTEIGLLKESNDTSWYKYTLATPSDGAITNPDADCVWTLTNQEGGGFTLKNKEADKYLVVKNSTGGGTVTLGDTGTVLYAVTYDAANKTFKIRLSSDDSGNQMCCNYGDNYGYRVYANRDSQGGVTGISFEIRFYKLRGDHTFEWDGVIGNGEHTEHCTDSGCTETRLVDCSFVTLSETPATCAAAGSKTERCSVCGFTRTEETPKSLLHIDGDDDGYCDTCGINMSSDQAIVDFAYLLTAGDPATTESFTLTGTITRVLKAYTSANGYVNIEMVIADREGMPVQCYHLTGDGVESIGVGDVIRVDGHLKNYNGTIEFDSGCTLARVNYLATIQGRNMSLGESLALGFFVKLNAKTYPGAIMVVTIDGTDEKTIALPATAEADGTYQFIYTGIVPSQLNDTIVARLLTGDQGEELDSKTFTMKEYLDAIPTSDEYASWSAAKKAAMDTLINDLEVYGREAQIKFDHNTDNLVVAATVTGSGRTSTESVRSMTPVIGSLADAEGADGYFKNANVIHENQNWIRVLYKDNKGDGNTTFLIQKGTAAGYEATLDQGYLCTDGIAPTDYGTTFTFTAIRGGVAVSTLTYSVNSYCTVKAGNAFVDALYNYGVSAAAFANAN